MHRRPGFQLAVLVADTTLARRFIARLRRHRVQRHPRPPAPRELHREVVDVGAGDDCEVGGEDQTIGEEPIYPQVKKLIDRDFDSMAMDTLKKGHYAFCCYIFSMMTEKEREDVQQQVAI